MSTTADSNIKRGRDLPGPKQIPFFGNFLQIKNARKAGTYHHVLENWSKDYGSIFRIKIFNIDFYVVPDYKVARDILVRRPSEFRRRIILEEAADEMGLNGVFTSDSERWKRLRQLTMSSLSTKYLQAFLPTLLGVSNRLVERWQEKSLDRKPIDVVDESKTYAADLMSNMVFAFDMDSLGLEHKEGTIRDHFNRIFPQWYKRINSPFFPYWKYFKLPADYRLHHSLREIKAIFHDVIDETRERLKGQTEDTVKAGSLVEAMVLATDEHGKPYTNEDIFANVFSIVLAGEDAVGNTIGWTINFLTEHPEVQEKIQAEVDAAFPRSTPLDEYDFDTWDTALPYTEAVLMESMRIKPIAPISSMQSHNEVEVNGIKFDAGSNFLLLPRVDFVNEQHFAKADQFIPERWLTPEGGESGGCPMHQPHNKKAYMPFGHGARFCSGSRLAMFEMKVLFALIARQFTIEKSSKTGAEDDKVKEKLTLLMEPDNCYMTLKPR